MKQNDKKEFKFLPYFAKYKFPIGVYIFIMVLQVIIDLVFAIFVAGIIETVTLGQYYLAIKKFIILFGLNFFANIISYTQDFIGYRVSKNVINNMRVDIVTQAFRISDKSYADHQTANFTQRIATDPATIYNKLFSFVWNVRTIVSSAVILIYIAFVSPEVGFISIAGMALVVVFERIRKRIWKKNVKICNKKGEKTSSLLNEIIISQKDIKSLNMEEKLRNKVVDLAFDSANYEVKTNTVNRTFRFVTNIIVNLLCCVMMVISVKLMSKGFMALTGFMIVYNNRYQIRNLAMVLSDVFGFMADIEVSVSRINELFEDDEYEIEKFGTKNLRDVQGKIVFDNVQFSYVEYKQKSGEEISAEKKYNKKHKIKDRVKTRIVSGKNKVFDKLSFEIEPNTSVAFVGKSGVGKTTILNLISKMYDTDKGKVLIDGMDIKRLNKESIRNAISLVSQSPYIFDMSIKENMLLAKPSATDMEIDKAIKDSALDDFIENLPNGLETIVGERGIKLSGGQRQRLAIARAMLKKSPIILFDESTSSLDNIAQAKIKKSIDSIKGKSTVVIVAHRLSTIKNVDKIFFLNNGEIVDSGSFNELFKRNKDFKTMFLAENL